jgi:hypothetical protein
MTSNIDEQIRQALRAAADGIEPPVQELVDGGLARGRRLLRRHRLAVVGTGLVAAAVVAMSAVMAPQLIAGQQDVAATGDHESEPRVDVNPVNPDAPAEGALRPTWSRCRRRTCLRH